MADTAQVLPLLRPDEGLRRVAIMGAFRVTDSRGRDLTPKGRKTRALLAAVLLSRGPLSRERLATMFWGDRGEEQAKASLRQALYELRDMATEPGAVIVVARDEVTANPCAFELDLDHACAGDAARLAASLEGLDSPLLADLDGVSPDFDDWLVGERSRRLQRLTDAALSAGRAALDDSHAQAAQRLADALARIDALDELAVRLGLEADRQAGDLSGLHRRYRRFAERLKAELGAAPSPETSHLFETQTANAGPAATVTQWSPIPASLRPPWWVAAAGAFVVLAVAFVLAWPRSDLPPSTPSLAVLPFRTAQAGYFGSGVSEAVFDLVARAPNLKLVGPASARIAAAGADPLATARRVGVAYVLSGEAESRGERMIVSARLTQAGDGRTLWSARYDRPREDVFAVQNEVAAAVAQHLGTRIAPAADPHRVTRPEVYDRYLQALGLARQRKGPALIEAKRLLQEAAALDPNYAPVFASLSEVTMLLADHPTAYGTIPMGEAQAEARVYARRALELSPGLGEAYAAYGLISLSDAQSLPFYERAVALDPQRADFHRWLGNSYQVVGRENDALREFQRAAALEPLWWICSEHLISQFAFMGRFKEAAEVAERFARISTDPEALARVRVSSAQARDSAAGFLRAVQDLSRHAPADRNLAVEQAKAWAMLGETERAVSFLAGYDPVGRLALRGDVDGLAALAEARGRGFWDLVPTYWGFAEALVDGGHGAVLLRLYDGEFRSPSEIFERDPMQALSLSPALITALNTAGRRGEAAAMAKLAFARLDSDVRGGVWEGSLAYDRATLLAVTGQRDAALAQLDRQLKLRWLQALSLPNRPLAARLPFRTLAGDPRLAAIQAQLDARVTAERALAGLPPRKT